MPRKKKETIRTLNVRPGATLKEIYAQARKEFTAADLQKYTEIEEMVPAEQVLAEMGRIHQEVLAKRQRRRQRVLNKPIGTNASRRGGTMPREKREPIPILRVRKGATLKEIYAKARKEFTAADLQKYTEIKEGVPFEQVIRECEEIHRKLTAKMKKAKGA